MSIDTMKNVLDISSFVGVTENERANVVKNYIAFEGMVYIHFVLAILGYVPLWSFCVGAFVYVPRWLISLHELQHCCTAKTINFFTKHNFLILTPFHLGYREMRDVHMRHHQYTATEQDSEYYHISGSWYSGLINVMFMPEQSTYFWIRDKGVDAELARGLLLRFTLFMMIVLSLGWQSLWYFIPVRLAYGTALFFFNYGLHRKNGEYGTYQVFYPTILEKMMLLIYGNTLLYSVSEHDIHHDYARIPGNKLRKARPFYQPKAHKNTN